MRRKEMMICSGNLREQKHFFHAAKQLNVLNRNKWEKKKTEKTTTKRPGPWKSFPNNWLKFFFEVKKIKPQGDKTFSVSQQLLELQISILNVNVLKRADRRTF